MITLRTNYYNTRIFDSCPREIHAKDFPDLEQESIDDCDHAINGYLGVYSQLHFLI
jgi:hypothetical protein